MGAKSGRVLRDLGKFGQTKKLKATAVGQHRTVPPHEFLQATEFLNKVRSRSQCQVVRIAQDDLGAG